MTTTTKTVQELEQAARDAQKALDDAREAEQQKARDAKRAEERARMDEQERREREKRAKILLDVQRQLKYRNVEMAQVGESLRPSAVVVDGKTERGYNFIADVSVEREYKAGGMFKRDTGRHVVVVGGGAYAPELRPARFPLKGTGGYNYVKIAERVKERLEFWQAQQVQIQKTQHARSAAEALAQRLRTQFNVSDGVVSATEGYHDYSHKWIENVAPHGRVYVKLGGAYSYEQAAVLLQAFAMVKDMEKNNTKKN